MTSIFEPKSDSLDLIENRNVVAKTNSGIKLWKSQCFIEILKFYAMDHKAHDVAKLQLLNKRCYDYFVPRVMSMQKMKLEMSPCLLSFFEEDVQK